MAAGEMEGMDVKSRIPFDFQKIRPLADPNLSSFIWSVADLLRGDYKQSEYGKVSASHNCSRMRLC
jgi:hypothetical protein